mmetsp:Transcript_46397/g.131213  ORF Transcript_46397/g.131213 Transcript_46397/m.131213 type:complete len:184 (-) Transcript_46397:107-658(-)
MQPPPGAESYSLGVTQILDELLAKHAEEEGGSSCSAGGDGGGKEAISRVFQRTSEFCGGVDSYLAASHGRRETARLRDLRREFEATNRGFNDTLNSTGGSLTTALKANEVRLQQISAQILEELKQREEEAAGEPENEDDDDDDLEKLLSECAAIQAEAGRFTGLKGTPPGWRRLDPKELQKPE